MLNLIKQALVLNVKNPISIIATNLLFIFQPWKNQDDDFLLPRFNKGYGSLVFLERECFRYHFQGIFSKLDLMKSIVKLIVLYDLEVWGPSLLESDWAQIERLLLELLHRFQRFTDSVVSRDQYPYPASRSSDAIALFDPGESMLFVRKGILFSIVC